MLIPALAAALHENLEAANAPDEEAPHKYRTLWISDIHMGIRGCKADFLIDFLRWHTAETVYLVGDIVDGWRLRRSWYWPQNHNDLVQKLLRMVRKGTRLVYIPGNHDEMFRDYTGLVFGGILVQQDAIHVTADGKRLLVLHGDEFDGIILYSKWLAKLGSELYDLSIAANHWFNWVRRKMGFSYWSLSQYLKFRVKNAVGFIMQYEETLLREARKRGVDGVVCGHIHHAELRLADGILYANDGDWVESCTALVEHFDGRLEILRWAKVQGKPQPISPAAPAPASDPEH